MIGRLDHLVLTVGDVGVSAHFYSEVLGLRAQTFGEGRTALVGDGWKINLHPASAPIVPHGPRQAAPTCASSSTSRWRTLSRGSGISVCRLRRGRFGARARGGRS